MPVLHHAILVASINVFGGFTVTARMLQMLPAGGRTMSLTLVQGVCIVAELLSILALAWSGGNSESAGWAIGTESSAWPPLRP